MKISGIILDNNGNPLEGANIIKFGNNAINTSTDSKGKFTIDSENIRSFDNFKISHVGYIGKMMKSSELQGNNIVLEEDIEVLEGVTLAPKPKPVVASPIQKYKTPLIVVGSLGLIAAGFLLIKKMTI